MSRVKLRRSILASRITAGLGLLVAGVALAATAPSFVLTWGSYGTAAGQFRGPVGIAASPDGTISTTEVDNVYRVQRFTSVGAWLTLWGSTGSAPGQFNYPYSIDTDTQGNLYISDALNDRIQKFTPSGTLLMVIGSYGAGNGQFNLPYGVAVDGNGNIFVADRNNDRIQKFSPSGTYLTQWGSSGTAAGKFNRPVGISVDPSGNVFVSDTFNYRVQKFSNNGAYLGQFGSQGSGAGQFQLPGDIAFDGSGNIYVTDTNNHRVQVFSSNLAYVLHWGGFGFETGQFVSPNGITIDRNGYLYVADTGNARIQKFGPVSPPGNPGGTNPNTPVGTNVVVSLGDITLTFDQVTQAGTTSQEVSTSGPTLPAGLLPLAPPDYHSVTTTASYTGQVSITLNYNPAGVKGSEAELLLYRYSSQAGQPTWVDITVQVRTGPNIIEGRTGQVATYLVAEVGNQTGIEDGPGVAGLRLHHAFPNPFHQSTRIEYDLPEGGRTRITIYDVTGRPVRTLQPAEYRAAGSYAAVWNGTDDGGRRLPPGVYFTRLETPDAVRTQRIVLTD